MEFLNLWRMLMFLLHLDAVETLASSIGLEIPYEKTLINLVDEDDYSILDEAVKVFETHLKESKKAINYLKSRNISGITAKKFQLGQVGTSLLLCQIYFETLNN